ncbi:MAG: sensor histidine kinase [Candidatus Binatia bacterium]
MSAPNAASAAPPLGSPAALQDAADAAALRERRRILVLVRTGLTLAVSYLLIFSASDGAPPPGVVAFAVTYIASNLLIAYLPLPLLGHAAFDVTLILVDTGAISCALLLTPNVEADVFVFYFTIILLASISDRPWLNLWAPVLTTAAYLGYLFLQNGVAEIMRPAILLRLPFLLLTGAFYGFFIDRVRRRERAMAEARERAQARTELLSTVTHDLKQPLWLAMQSAALLYDRLPEGEAPTRELAGQVVLSLKRMESLALNFLELNQIEARALRVVSRRVSLDRIVEDLVDAYRPALALKRLHVRLELARPLPDAWIDPLQTERCLANLLDNAIKYTPADGVITMRVEAEDGGLVAVVGDSGPGIPPERAATVFARFQDGTDVAGRRSTGLGLYIAGAIATAMGGELTLDAAQTRGAWFRLWVPMARSAAAAASRPAEFAPSVA